MANAEVATTQAGDKPSRIVDATDYAPDRVPHPQLRVLFAQHGVAQTVRRAIADAGIVSLEIFAQAGENGKEAATTISGMIASQFPAAEAEKQLELMRLGAVWSTARAMSTARATAESKYADDPGKIPQIPDSERLQMRMAFKTAHPELDLCDHNEPHPRFVDKLRRDWIVHGRVLLYTLDQVRVVADKASTKTHAILTSEDFIKAVREETPLVKIDSDEQVTERVFALFVALEYIGVLVPDDFKLIALRYIVELRKLRREHPGLPYLVKADSIIRKEVDDLTKEDPSVTFAVAFKKILDTKPHLWTSAIAAVEWESIRATPKRGRSPRSQRAVSSEPARAKAKAKPRQQQSSKIGRKPSPQDRAKNKAKKPSPQVPQEEMVELIALSSSGAKAKVCRFFNSSVGCARGSKCNFSHTCLVCGAGHSKFSAHK